MSELGREFSNLQNQLPTVGLGRAIRRAIQGPGRFDCSLRVTDGSVPGLKNRWRARSSFIDGDALVHGPMPGLRANVTLPVRAKGSAQACICLPSQGALYPCVG